MASINAGVVGVGEHRCGSGVRHVGEHRADADHAGAAHGVGHLQDGLAVRPPAELGLGGAHQHDGGRSGGAPPEAGARPAQRRHDAGLDHDPRAVHGEVDELLRLDLGQRLRPPRLEQVLDGTRRGVAGVVPPGEAGDHHRAYVEPVTAGPGREVQMTCPTTATVSLLSAAHDRALGDLT